MLQGATVCRINAAQNQALTVKNTAVDKMYWPRFDSPVSLVPRALFAGIPGIFLGLVYLLIALMRPLYVSFPADSSLQQY